MGKKNTPARKIFVLDTSVILHDGEAIINFQDNDVAIPLPVLEELDQFKSGNSTKNFEAREFIRFLDQRSAKASLRDWIPIDGRSHGKFKVVMPQSDHQPDFDQVFSERSADHRILYAAISLQREEPKAKVILVTKDINLRLKAKALNLPAEDYLTGKVPDAHELYTGKSTIEEVPSAVIDALFETGRVSVDSALKQAPLDNHYFIVRNGTKSALAVYRAASRELVRVEKHSAFGIVPKNAEQTFALDALFNDDIKLVTIQGGPGTGKTLLALAGALDQKKEYRQILISRPVVPLSNKDIGFLPGDVNSKLNPYMEPLWDNLKFIKTQFSPADKRYKQIETMLEEEKIVITPLAYIRGRSLSRVIFIIDEAQNLTPHEIKTIITRAGEGAKFIFTGDVRQIDTPYLDAQSNGLSYVIDKLKGQSLFAHVTLEKGERSELANIASELL